jgi:hypothetical protein
VLAWVRGRGEHYLLDPLSPGREALAWVKERVEHYL